MKKIVVVVGVFLPLFEYTQSVVHKFENYP